MKYGPYKYLRPGLTKKEKAPKGKKTLVTRQRVYQIRMKKLGKCIICGSLRDRSMKFCNKCRAKRVQISLPPSGVIEA